MSRRAPQAQIAGWLTDEAPPDATGLSDDPTLLAAVLAALDTVEGLAPEDPDGALDLLEGLAEDALTRLSPVRRAALLAECAFDGLGPRAAALVAPFGVGPVADVRVEALLAGEGPSLSQTDGPWAAQAVETLSGLIAEFALDEAAALHAEARWLDPLLQALADVPDQPTGPVAAAEVRPGPAVVVGDGPEVEPPLQAPIPVEGPPGLPPIDWPTPTRAHGWAGWAGWAAVGALAAAAVIAFVVWRPSELTPVAPTPIPVGIQSLVPRWAGPLLPADPAPIEATANRPRLMPIPAGTSWLGSPADEPGRQPDETRRPVTLTRPFWMARTEVTQAQWAALMGNRPAKFDAARGGGPDHPAEQLSWYDAVAYANALSAAEGRAACYTMADCRGTPGVAGFVCDAVTFAGLDCRGYRLPTEAEWEHAARAGSESATYGGPFELLGERHAPVLDDIAWYSGNSGVERGGMACGDWSGRPPGVDAAACATHPVGTKSANAWGLHDMLGNVWEWTTDGHGDLSPEPVTDPVVAPAERMVTKGCGWFREARFCRAANRYRPKPGYRAWVIGVRIVRTMDR